MRRTHFFLLLIILLLHSWVFTAAAQQSPCSLILSGSVADADEKAPLGKAIILIRELERSTETDKEGHYHFYNLCPGTYNFIITHADCDTINIRIRIESNLVKNFSLPHHYNQLSTVQVLSTSRSQELQVRESLTARDLAESRGQTLGEILKRLTGVTVLQTGSTIFKPVIHGLHSQRIILINNGVRLEGQQWGSEHAPEIDPYVADRFVVVKGAGAIRYGSDAIGGAVLIEPRPLPTDLRGRAEINTGYFSNNRQYVANVQWEQNSKTNPAFSWRTHVTYKRGGNARTPAYWLHNTGLQEFNVAAMAGYRKSGYRAELFMSAFSTTIGIFSGSHIGNLTDLQNAIASEKPLQNIDRFTYRIGRPYQQVQHYLAKFKLFWSGSEGHRWQVVAAHQENDRHEYDRALISERPELSLSIGTSSIDLLRETTRSTTRSCDVGWQVMYQQNVWSGSRFFIPNFRTINVGMYGVERWQLGAYALEAALRVDYRSLTVFRNRNGMATQSDRQFFNPSATLSVSKKFSEQSQLRSNTSLAWRAPQVNELYVNGLHHGTASFEIGDSSILAERSFKQLVQWDYRPDSNWTIDLTMHGNYIADFINLVPTVPATLTLRGAYPTFRYAQIDAWIYGSDIRIEHQWSPSWKAGIKGALLWARDLTQKDWLQQMPSHRFETQLSYLFATSRFQNSYVSPSVLRIFRQTRVPGTFIDYLAAPPAYTLVNLSMGTDCRVGKRSLGLVVGVNNLLNTRYRDYMNRFRYFTDEVGRNVVVQLKWKL
ncbi:MAG: TonB-dependent receptor [Bacteroidetes bacterium]|nr:TonB-dependent receptor [Bacteroidota bacterium]